MNEHLLWVISAIGSMIFGWVVNRGIRLMNLKPKDQALYSIIVGLMLGLMGLLAEQIMFLFTIIGLALSMMKQYDDSL